MRQFVIYSKNASTFPKINDLKKAGRIDILLHSIISALFSSNLFREDVQIHLILMGKPNPPRHIRIVYEKENTISKKNLKKLIEMALKKYKKGDEIKVHPGVYVDNLSIEKLILKFQTQNNNIFVLDKTGEHIKNIEKNKLKSGIFILGDHTGFDKKTKKFMKKNLIRLSLGDLTYFTSQSITIINYELDNLD
jgi:tRNA (pseudouridine54-N1)-methyltransferase